MGPDLVFREWVRLTVAELTPDILASRQRAVAAVAAGKISKTDTLALLRLAADVRPNRAEDGIRSRLGQAAADQDINWPTGENKLAISMLASGVVQLLLLTGGERYETLALGVLAAHASGLRNSPFASDLAAVASTYYEAHSLRERQRILGLLKRPAKAVDDDEEEDSADSDSHAEAAEEIAELRQIVSLQQEQLDLSWLLLAEALSSGESIATISPTSLPIRCGFDLALLSRQSAGPPAARAVLRRLLRMNPDVGDEQRSIVSAVHDLPPATREAWKSRISNDTLVNGLLPISTAISLANEVTDLTWVPSFAATTLLDPEARLGPERLAWQAFLEALFLKSLDSETNRA